MLASVAPAAAAACRGRNRWFLALTLANNAALRGMRKHAMVVAADASDKHLEELP